jgi:stage II sporulation protein AA (anti-sigma F factor antagonist)
MGIQDWSDNIVVAELGDDPQFSDDVAGLIEGLEQHPRDVVLNFAAVGFVNSSDVAQLLRLRKLVLGKGKKLVLCDVNTQVWGVFLVTGLEKVFEFTKDVSTALAGLQLANGGPARK